MVWFELWSPLKYHIHVSRVEYLVTTSDFSSCAIIRLTLVVLCEIVY